MKVNLIIKNVIESSLNQVYEVKILQYHHGAIS